MLLRRVIGDALRARRQDQHRTLREVSHAANVSLGYLSEIERGQKEASSELLAAICEALGSQLSDVLRDASDTLAQVERPAATGVDTAAPVPAAVPGAAAAPAESAAEPAGAELPVASVAVEERAGAISDGTVSVSIRRNGPLRTTLHAVRTRRAPAARSGELTRPVG